MGTKYKLAVDIGGTFTDVVLEQESSGSHMVAKVLTTYDDPADAVMQAIDQLLTKTGFSASDAQIFLHGTTLATNALIQRSGAKTALFTTYGHRDSIEMALENRFEQYDVNIDRPQPLVPRELRFPIIERIDASGKELIPLDYSSVQEAANLVLEHGVESVAVGFLHAYANSSHEEEVGEYLVSRCPEVSVTLASKVCPEIREYERLSTACANAYVRPLMETYLQSLSEKLVARGIQCPMLLMTSGGGLTTLENAMQYPIRLVESGPAGGAILASAMGASLGYDEILSFDMGGTTAKIALINKGRPLVSRSFEVDRVYRFKKGSGLPVRVPVIEMVEIGAGGGSKARIDKLNRITVGPDSTGSEPGPASYGKGGKSATVTDADVQLGRLDSAEFAGGQLPLDVEAARRVIDLHIARPLGLDEVEAAFGVSEVVDENMVSAARAHAAEWGMQLQGRTIVAFGGAAPLHAARLADKLKIDRVVIPNNAGVGSAIGFLIAPISYEVVRSRYALLSKLNYEAVNSDIRAMREEAESVVAGAATGDSFDETNRAYMRYVGQGYEIPVVYPAGLLAQDSADILRVAFEREYKRLYQRLIPDLDVEILSWTLTLRQQRAPDQLRRDISARELNSLHLKDSNGRLFDSTKRRFVAAKKYYREELIPEGVIEGPAVVIEGETSSIVSSNFDARVLPSGELVLERKGVFP